MTKACPECKSLNTRQMDISYGQRAYCLSCYHQFANFQKVEVNKVPSKDYSNEVTRYLKKAVDDIKRIKIKVDKIEEGIVQVIREHNEKERLYESAEV